MTRVMDDPINPSLSVAFMLNLLRWEVTATGQKWPACSDCCSKQVLARQDASMNVFVGDAGTAACDQARPYFHPLIVKRLAEVLEHRRLHAQLDVTATV